MTNDPVTDPRIRTYLAAVEAAMTKAGASSATVRSTCASLEEHIREAMATRSTMPIDEAVAAVLAELDRAEDFALQNTQPAPGHLGGLAFALSLGAVPIAIAVGLLVSAAGGDGKHIGWITFFFLEAATACLGIVAWAQPYAKSAVLTAVGLVALLLLVSG